MILQPPARNEFDLRGGIQVDLQNSGFTETEIEQLASPREAQKFQEIGGRGARSVREWLDWFWKRDRQIPPEIKNLKSEFGYLTQPLLTDLMAVAGAQKTELAGMIKARAAKYNFFILRCGVYIAPNDGEKFEALKFEIKYKDDNVSTLAMLPGPQVNKILELGGRADVGVTGEVDFGFPKVSLETASVEADAKAKLEAKFIVSFHYELKTHVVDSYGMSNPFCKWLMHKGDKLRNDVLFYPIIMAPKSVRGFECEFQAFFKIGHANWKNSEFFLKPPITVRVSV